MDWSILREIFPKVAIFSLLTPPVSIFHDPQDSRRALECARSESLSQVSGLPLSRIVGRSPYASGDSTRLDFKCRRLRIILNEYVEIIHEPEKCAKFWKLELDRLAFNRTVAPVCACKDSRNRARVNGFFPGTVSHSRFLDVGMG
jgi:hypothetical protein